MTSLACFGSGGLLCFLRLGVTISLCTLAEVCLLPVRADPTAAQELPDGAPVSGFRIVRAYPHDRTAFTQGLVFANNRLYEGTGLRGRSSLREVELETGRVVRSQPLPNRLFGEGITVSQGRLVQLTWHAGLGLVFDEPTFTLVRTFKYATEGWGITTDGQRLVMSDGSATLRFLNADNFRVVREIRVHDGARPVSHLNELEYVQGEIYANVWKTDRIARIDPESGKIVGWIDLAGLLVNERGQPPTDVLNGIAYDAERNRLFVTGKLWPKLFEIEILPPR